MKVRFHKNEDPKWSYDEIVNSRKLSEVFADERDTMYLTFEGQCGDIRLLNLSSCQILDPDLIDTNHQFFRKMDFTTITLS